MWKLSDGIRLVTMELAIRSCDCVWVTHTVPQKPILRWSALARLPWGQNTAIQLKQMGPLLDTGVGVDTACTEFHTFWLSPLAKTGILQRKPTRLFQLLMLIFFFFLNHTFGHNQALYVPTFLLFSFDIFHNKSFFLFFTASLLASFGSNFTCIHHSFAVDPCEHHR